MRLSGALFVIVLLLVPRPGFAQVPTAPPQPDQRWFFFDINLVGSTGSVADQREFSRQFLSTGELGTYRARYPKPSDARVFPLIDVGGGLMVMPRLGLGIVYSQTTYEDAASISATVPHPFFLQTPGTGTSSTDPLRRTEHAAHLVVTGVAYSTNRTEWRVSVGPTIFVYSADMVKDIAYSQKAEQGNPQNIVTVTGYTTAEVHGSALGAHVGSDFAFDVARSLAVTGGVRYAVGTVFIDLEPLTKLRQEIRVGDWRVFAGLRWRIGKSSQ